MNDVLIDDGWRWPAALVAARAHSRELRRQLRNELAWQRARRWPVDQLYPHLDTIRRRRLVTEQGNMPVTRNMVLADLCNITRETARRWTNHGMLLDQQVEQAAFALGLHPVNVWTNWYDVDLEETA